MGYTSDWVTANHDRWVQTLGHLRERQAHIAELGSYEGRSACWFVEHVLTAPGSTMWCFDPWKEDPARERVFDLNTEDLRAAGKLRKVRGDVWDLVKLPPHYFDAIYVDGDHTAFACLTDAIVAWHVLKPGGLMIFDDYGIGPPYEQHNGPALGIDAFLAAARGRCNVLAKQYQVIVQKLID